MTNRAHRFWDRDIRRVIKAAQTAGLDVGQVRVNPHTGEITVGPAPGSAATTRNSWDDVLTNAEDAQRAS